jgi:hypothetical protein
VKTFFHVLGTPFRALMTPEGRRAWALLLLAGCSVTMTAYVIGVLWIVKTTPQYAFYLGIAGFLMIAIVTTGFAGLLVRRSIDLNALGVQFRVNDQEIQNIADRVAAAVPPPPAGPTVVVQAAPPGDKP